MNQDVLLITADDTLAQRVGAALLAPPLACRIGREAVWPLAQAPQCNLILLDDRLLLAAEAREPDEKVIPMPRRDGPSIVLLESRKANLVEAFRRGVVDSVDPGAGLSKLAYVVRQQLAASHLRRIRQRQEGEQALAPPRNGFSLRHEINNPLAGILGNAELALNSRVRVPLEVRQRLERILDLALQIRDLLHSPQARALADSALPRSA